MKKIAIVSYVENTLVPNYDNNATRGVSIIAKKIITEIKQSFQNSIEDIGPRTKRKEILDAFIYAREKLDDNGLCFFYFHGHGDSILNVGEKDEVYDQVLVCNDEYLLDDHIDEILRSFLPTQRIFSIVDSCSSETVIEWSKYTTIKYPQIIHIASSADGENSYSWPSGGIFSQRLYNLLYNGNFWNMSYDNFITKIKSFTINQECFVSKTDNISNKYLNSKLFT